MRQKIKSLFKRIVLLEKSPEAGEVVLRQRRVFTLPSKPGLVYAGMLIILFLTSTNYNLNLGFGMTYMLAGLAAVNALFSFRNLAYLRLRAAQGVSVFAGEVAEFSIHINNPQQLNRYAIHIGFLDAQSVEQTIDLAAESSTTIRLRTLSKQRGYLACPRIRLHTGFPLGLLRAWSTWLPASQILIYPTPELNPPALPFGTDNLGSNTQNNGNEDFAGVRSYQTGDPLKHLSWKHIARVDLDAGGNLVSKQFAGTSSGEIYLDFSTLSPQLDLELRISRMTSWVLKAERLQLDYAFKLPTLNLPPSQGEVHCQSCLSALALYALTDTELETAYV